MPGIITRLAGAQLGNSVATIYTVPATTTLADGSIYLWNDDTAARIVTLHFVPSAGSPLADNYIIESYSIGAKSAVLLQPKQVILTGGTIRAFADVAAKVSIQISGILVNTATDTTNVARLYHGQLSAALATVYTATPNQIADCCLWFYNFDTVARTISLQFIPSGQSPLLDYTLLNGFSIQSKGYVLLQPRQRIDVGGTIRANADVANKVTLAVSGLQL